MTKIAANAAISFITTIILYPNFAFFAENARMLFQDRIDFRANKLFRLLRRASDKFFRIEYLVEMVPYNFKIFIFFDQFDKVILFTFLLDLFSRLQRTRIFSCSS